MTDPNKPDQNASDDDWEKAMAEQQGEETGGDDADPWAEALAEQEAAEGGATASIDQDVCPRREDELRHENAPVAGAAA